MEIRIGPVRFVVYKAAEPRWGVIPNRYYARSIGVGLSLGRLVFSLVWRRPPSIEKKVETVPYKDGV